MTPATGEMPMSQKVREEMFPRGRFYPEGHLYGHLERMDFQQGGLEQGSRGDREGHVRGGGGSPLRSDRI